MVGGDDHMVLVRCGQARLVEMHCVAKDGAGPWPRDVRSVRDQYRRLRSRSEEMSVPIQTERCRHEHSVDQRSECGHLESRCLEPLSTLSSSLTELAWRDTDPLKVA